MLNLNPLFVGSLSKPGFHQKLALPPEEREMLNDARRIIRADLREGLPALIKQAYPTLKIPTPKFHTQGSCAYQTVIWPAHIPPQQVDMDDGCYMPLSFMKGAQPDIASKFFFGWVELVLTPVAKRYGWKINPGGPKPTCTRIELDATKHIDIPLYAIPDQEFEKLLQFADARAAGRILEAHADNEWDLLPADTLLLAHREEGWKPSDPRPLRDWIIRQALLKSEQLRRLMRYAKAWRDWIWPNGAAPSSILLMVAVDRAMLEAEARDDLAFLKVAAKLPGILAGEVENPVSPTRELLSDKLDEDGIRSDVVERARALHTALQHAIMVCDQPEEACRSLLQVFGPRFPADVVAIEKVKAAAVVTATPARKIEKEPIVGRSQAG